MRFPGGRGGMPCVGLGVHFCKVHKATSVRYSTYMTSENCMNIVWYLFMYGCLLMDRVAASFITSLPALRLLLGPGAVSYHLGVLHICKASTSGTHYRRYIILSSSAHLYSSASTARARICRLRAPPSSHECVLVYCRPCIHVGGGKKTVH